MIKTVQFFYSPPKKRSPGNKGHGPESKTVPTSSTSSDSEPDTVSINSSASESEPKDGMKTNNRRESPVLGYSPPDVRGKGSSEPEQNKRKGLKGKIIKVFSPGRDQIKLKKKINEQEEHKLITADQIRELIKNKKFFEAGQDLLAMEKQSYDQKREEGKVVDRNETEALYDLLKHETLHVIKTSIRIASSNPELLQNTVRAITEQVKEDERAASEKAAENKLSSRPRKWKEDWKATIKELVAERMQVPPFAEDEGISAVAHSFRHMGKTMKDDLTTVVQHIKPHYPKDFRVCCVYAEFYDQYFSSQLEAIADFELSHRDTSLILTWVWDVYPNKIKKDPILVKELEEAKLGSLFTSEQIKHLEEAYLSNELESIKRCLARCLEMEVTRWMQNREPEKLDGHFHSELSIDAIQIVFGGQKRAKELTPELAEQISPSLLVALLTFLQSYKRELKLFIKENKQHRYFKAIITANINNCSEFRDYTEKSTTPAQDDVKREIFTILGEIQSAGSDVLLEDLFQGLKPLFKKFTQKTWLSCTGIMKEIIASTSQHMSTFQTLKEPFRQAIMEKIHLHLVRELISRLIKKAVKLKSAEQQNNFSQVIQKNASILHSFCTENGSNATWLHPVLPSLAEILRLQDTNAIMVEVGGLASKYPDISNKHLEAILYFKGNLSSSDTRSILSVLDIRLNATLPPSSLFSAMKAS